MLSLMRKLLFSLLLVASVSFAAGDEDAIRKAEKAWATAVVASDYNALDSLLTSQMFYAHSTGELQSRDVYLGKFKANLYHYKGIDYSSTMVKLYGDAAVAHSKVHLYGVSDTGPFDVHVMMMHLWVKQGGRWMLAAHQTTKVP